MYGGDAMKKIIYSCSILCGVTALITFIMGIRVLTGHNFIIGLRIFNMASRGSFTGLIGNLLGIAVTCLGFGMLAVLGFGSSQKAKKEAFIYGIAMTVVCLVSMIASVFSRTFTVGDLFLTALPAVYTLAVLKSA